MDLPFSAFAGLRDSASLHLSSVAGSILSVLPNPRALRQIPLLSSAIAPQYPLQRSKQIASCPNAQLSCHNTSAVSNTCCFNFPGGQILQTQFWDTKPAVGPADSWTIHGLWPDHCDGGFDQYCDSERSYNNITEILRSFGEHELLSYMNIYWKDYQGSDSTLWSHEWQKHGTCINTMDTKCYIDYVSQEEVVDYFEKTVELFKGLSTYDTLSAAGIVPSKWRTYASRDIEDVLQAMHGAPVTVRCRNGELDEVWYHFDVRGSAQSGQWMAAKPDGAKSNCPRRVHYYPKDMSSIPTSSRTMTSTRPSTNPTSSPTNTPDKPFTGAGFVEILVDNAPTGCLIGDGSWYTSGTCATYHAEDDPAEVVELVKEADHLFTLTTRKGPCGFLKGTFVCGRDVGKQDIFSDAGDGILALKKNATFWADQKPGHAQRANIYADQADHKTDLRLAWKSR